jgi:hypothetical protein
MATRGGSTSSKAQYDEQMQAALAVATKLMESLDLQAVALRSRGPGEEVVAFDCFGTAGTLGTFCGCGGTFGTFGCSVATIEGAEVG